MTRREIVLTLKPVTFLDRIWYRRLGIEPPLSSSRDGGRCARLVPYRFRGFHRAYAASHGYFWLPCPLCDRPFGGHEWGGDLPDPMKGPGSYIGICSECTRSREGK